MRHLHYSHSDSTVCGLKRKGERFYASIPSVHVSKASKTDCQTCRTFVREDIRARFDALKRKAVLS